MPSQLQQLTWMRSPHVGVCASSISERPVPSLTLARMPLIEAEKERWKWYGHCPRIASLLQANPTGRWLVDKWVPIHPSPLQIRLQSLSHTSSCCYYGRRDHSSWYIEVADSKKATTEATNSNPKALLTHHAFFKLPRIMISLSLSFKLVQSYSYSPICHRPA